MAAGLNDSNIKKAIALIARRGIDKSFWQDHRAGVASGSGVGKACDMLRRLGVAMTGDGQKVKPHDINTALGAFKDLLTALKKAKGKCNKKLQGHTIKFCEAYEKHVETCMRELQEMESSLGKEGQSDPKEVEKAKRALGKIVSAVGDAKSEITDMLKDLQTAEGLLKSAQETYLKHVKAEGPIAQEHHNTFRKTLVKALQTANVDENKKATKSYLEDFKKYNAILGQGAPEGLGKQFIAVKKEIMVLVKACQPIGKKCDSIRMAHVKLMQYADQKEQESDLEMQTTPGI